MAAESVRLPLARAFGPGLSGRRTSGQRQGRSNAHAVRVHPSASASQHPFSGGAPIGRTIPTFRRVIDHEKHRWDDMRRGLDPEHQRAFDAVFQRARRHASAAGNQGALDPLDAILMTVLVELEAELQRVLARLAWLENDVERPRPATRRRHPDEEPIFTQAPHAEEEPVEEPMEDPMEESMEGFGEEHEEERQHTLDRRLPA